MYCWRAGLCCGRWGPISSLDSIDAVRGMRMKKPKLKVSSIKEVEGGKAYYWHKRKDGTFVEASVCCDCDLVHMIEMKPGKNRMRVKVWREDEATEKLRAKNGTGPK